VTDPRLSLSNGRVAHSSRQGEIAAGRFTDGTPMRCAQPVADLLDAPNGARQKQMLFGHGFTLLEEAGGWAFGFDTVDHYTGYLDAAALTADYEPSHRVWARATHIYSAPDLKAPDLASLSFLSEVEVIGEHGAFAELGGGGFVPRAHLAPLSRVADDPVAIAEQFRGTPYLWGGNSAFGMDCSGLIQLAAWAAANACPRDSDLQATLGTEVTGPLARGDLLFWKGHVAMVVDETRLIHANAHAMAVAYEEVDAAIARIEAQGDGPVTARRRF
jgi:cell wall-associated NlpC family hydrolase